MLGKLIKFDLKSGARIFLLLHCILLAVALAGRLLFMDHLDFSEMTPALLSSIVLFASLMLFLLIAVCFCTWLLIAARFYRSLFTGEGYPTWTLPASAVEHLWAKIISGIMWYVADCIVVAAVTLILVTGKNITDAYSAVAPEVTAELGMPLSSFGFYMFILMMISCFSSVITTYFCIAVGQLFPAHRVLCAIAAYFISGLVVQTVSMGLMFLFRLFPGINLSVRTGEQLAQYLFSAIGLSIIIMFAVSIAEYIATHYIMKKKINLL